jgi:hypothetical protein
MNGGTLYHIIRGNVIILACVPCIVAPQSA